MFILKGQKGWEFYFRLFYAFNITLMIGIEFGVEDDFISEMLWIFIILSLDVWEEIIKYVFLFDPFKYFLNKKVKYFRWIIFLGYLVDLLWRFFDHIVHDEPISSEPNFLGKRIHHVFVVKGTNFLLVQWFSPLNFWDFSPNTFLQNIFIICLNGKQLW